MKELNTEEIQKIYTQADTKAFCVKRLAEEYGVPKSTIICELMKSGYKYEELKRAYPNEWGAAKNKYQKFKDGEAALAVNTDENPAIPAGTAPEQEEPVALECKLTGEELKEAAEQLKANMDEYNNSPLLQRLDSENLQMKKDLEFYQGENTKLDEENIKLTQENAKLKKTIEELEKGIEIRDKQWDKLKEENAKLQEENRKLERESANFKKMNVQLSEEYARTRTDRDEAREELKKMTKDRTEECSQCTADAIAEIARLQQEIEKLKEIHSKDIIDAGNSWRDTVETWQTTAEELQEKLAKERKKRKKLEKIIVKLAVK